MIAGYLGLKAIGSTVSAISIVTGTMMAAVGFTGPVTGTSTMLLVFILWSCIIVVAYRKRSMLAARFEQLSQRWLIVLGATLMLMPVIGTIGQLAQASMVESSWFGEVALFSNFGGIALNFCIIVFLLTTLWKLNDHYSTMVE